MAIDEKYLAELKEELKKEIIADLETEKIKHPVWRKAYKHLSTQAGTIEGLQITEYWRMVESIRAVVKFTFGLRQVLYLNEEQYPQAIKLIDDVVAAVKAARS